MGTPNRAYSRNMIGTYLPGPLYFYYFPAAVLRSSVLEVTARILEPPCLRFSTHSLYKKDSRNRGEDPCILLCGRVAPITLNLNFSSSEAL